MTHALEDVIRVEGGRVLATLIRLTGSFDLAEDALQEAAIAAVQTWSRRGVPRNPAAWLTTAARNSALDRMRREARRDLKEREAVRLLETDSVPHDGRDDRLRLLFTCCHPALSPEAQVALALRTIGGLTTAEIARAFLVPEPTMGQRISRAKRKIATAHIPYRVPDDHELPDRLQAVLATVYLVFTTGHHAPHGQLGSRVDLAEEGLRLARLLVELMPDEPECVGLLSLILTTHARRDTRVDAAGNVVLLVDQDRSRWDRGAIDEAARMLRRSLQQGRTGRFQIEAAIASVHGLAPSFAATDWAEIADLYRALEDLRPTGVVRVNRAVAVAHRDGPEAGLELLETVSGLDHWHLYWSTRAELFARAGRHDEAVAAFRAALACDMNDTDRRFLARRLDEVTRD